METRRLSLWQEIEARKKKYGQGEEIKQGEVLWKRSMPPEKKWAGDFRRYDLKAQR